MRGISIDPGFTAEGENVLELDGRAFRELLASTDKLVVAMFYLPECPACKIMIPVFDRLSREMSEEAVFIRIDGRSNLDTALQYGVVATPTILLFCRKTFLLEIVGFIDAIELKNAIEAMVRHRSDCAGQPMKAPFEMNGER